MCVEMTSVLLFHCVELRLSGWQRYFPLQETNVDPSSLICDG